MITILLGACFLLTWLAAGLFFGLWMGERGRRLDLQFYVGKEGRPTSGPEPPVVRRQPHPDEEAFDAVEVNAIADAVIAEAARDGRDIPPEDAIREAQSLLHRGFARAGRAE